MDHHALRRLIDPLKRKVALGISRAIVRLVKDSFKIQRVQVEVFKDEVRDSVERFQNYGFTSVPHEGAEAIVLFLGGDRSHGAVIVADDRRYRLTGLENGEVAIYTDEGDYIKLKRGNQIEIHTDKATFSKDVQILGKLDVTKDITSLAEISDVNGTMGEMRTDYNVHKHPGVNSGLSSTQTTDTPMI